jgi:hypothetical protein
VEADWKTSGNGYPLSLRGEMGILAEAKLRPIEREYREVFPGVSVHAGLHIQKRDGVKEMALTHL